MLVKCKLLNRFLNVNPQSILHIGAHEGEELDHYLANGWGTEGITWVDMQLHKLQVLEGRIREKGLNHIVVHSALWHQVEEMEIYEASNSESSSILEPDLHLKVHPEISFIHKRKILTDTLSSHHLIQNKTFELVNIDTQGAEMNIIKGGENLICGAEYLYLEVNRLNLYKNCPNIVELSRYLKELGFQLVLAKWTKYGWGDAIYIRKDVAQKLNFIGLRVALVHSMLLFEDIRMQLRSLIWNWTQLSNR